MLIQWPHDASQGEQLEGRKRLEGLPVVDPARLD